MEYTVHGILQARILKWVAFPFSSGSSQPRNRIGKRAQLEVKDVEDLLTHRQEQTIKDIFGITYFALIDS